MTALMERNFTCSLHFASRIPTSRKVREIWGTQRLVVVVQLKGDFDDDFDRDSSTILCCGYKFPLLYGRNRIVVKVGSRAAGYLQVLRQAVGSDYKVNIDVALLVLDTGLL